MFMFLDILQVSFQLLPTILILFEPLILIEFTQLTKYSNCHELSRLHLCSLLFGM